MVNLREHEEAKALENHFDMEAPEPEIDPQETETSESEEVSKLAEKSTRATAEKIRDIKRIFLPALDGEQRELRRKLLNKSWYHSKCEDLYKRAAQAQLELAQHKSNYENIPLRLEECGKEVVALHRKKRYLENKLVSEIQEEKDRKFLKETLPLLKSALVGAHATNDIDALQEWGTLLYSLGILR